MDPGDLDELSQMNATQQVSRYLYFMMIQAEADVTCFPTKKDTPRKVNKLGKMNAAGD
jgi:hypothetical protein